MIWTAFGQDLDGIFIIIVDILTKKGGSAEPPIRKLKPLFTMADFRCARP